MDSLMKILLTLIAVLLMAMYVWWGWRWLHQKEAVVAIDISAAYDVPDNAHPVFAQFIYTQKLVLPELIRATHFVVPVYVPQDNQGLQIDLLRHKQLIGRWRYRPTINEGVDFARLPLASPLLLDGDLEVIFNGSHIAHHEAEQAPRLFTETSDKVYPAGSYQVAQNEKQGNISLQLWGEKTRYEQWTGARKNQLVRQVAEASRWLLALPLIAAAPLSLWRVFGDAAARRSSAQGR